MKILLTILLSTFALAATMQAQQAEETPTPGKKHAGKEHSGKDHPGKDHPAETQPAAKANPNKEGRPNNADRPGQAAKEARRAAAEAQQAKQAPVAPDAKPLPKAEAAAKKHGKNKHPVAAEAAPNAPATPEAPPVSQATEPVVPAGKHKKNHGAAATNSTNSSTSTNTQTKVTKLDTQTVTKIKSEHASFKAQPRPDQVPTVTFTADRRLEGSDQWQGADYGVYRSYRPERHDESYYHKNYQRVELISGGYYYLHDGYWYPAWGYDNSHQYYAYDAPIYAGRRAEPLDRVIADVQSVLQEQGYYKGDVDGLLGPLTREALVGYQSDAGLYRTAVIDEPTLDALGLE